MRKILRSIVIVLTIVLFAVAGYYIWDRVREHNVSERMAQVIHLEDRRDLSPDLISYLSDTSAVVRRRAVLAVGRIGGPKSAPAVFEMLTDSATFVATSAAFAVGLTGEKEYAAKLLDVAFDLPAPVAMEAVQSAGRLADSTMSEVAERLVDYLQHPAPEVRGATCKALLYAGASSKSDAILSFMRTEKDPEARIAGLYALSRLKVATAAALFIDNLSDPDPFVRSICIRGLRYADSTEAGKYLPIALNDNNPNVVASAIGVLASRKDEKAQQLLARKVEIEKDERLVVALFDALRRQENPKAARFAMGLFRDSIPDNIAAAAAKYLAVIQKDRAVSLLDSLSINRGNAYLKAACAEAYSLYGDVKIIPRLAVLFSDPAPQVRAAAFSALVKINPSEVEYYIRKALTDSDMVPVSLALSEIQQRRLTEYLPQLRTMMEAGKKTDADIRRSLVDVASAICADSTLNDSNAVQILLDGLMDREYVIRREAAAAYKKAFDKDESSSIGRATTRISTGRIKSGFEKYVENPMAVITTSKGEFTIELDYDAAPLNVLNFIELAEDDFYDSVLFHRIIPDFVVQGGCPRGDGWGGPAWNVRCEYSPRPYRRGTVGIATSGKDTGGSQFFIALSPQPHLEGRYTVIGRVTAGMDIVDRIVRGDTIDKIEIRGN